MSQSDDSSDRLLNRTELEIKKFHYLSSRPLVAGTQKRCNRFVQVLSIYINYTRAFVIERHDAVGLAQQGQRLVLTLAQQWFVLFRCVAVACE